VKGKRGWPQCTALSARVQIPKCRHPRTWNNLKGCLKVSRRGGNTVRNSTILSPYLETTKPHTRRCEALEARSFMRERDETICNPSNRSCHFSNEIPSCIRSDTSSFLDREHLPSSNLPVSFNKSSSWRYCSGAVAIEVLHGIKVALPRTKSRKRTT